MKTLLIGAAMLGKDPASNVPLLTLSVPTPPDPLLDPPR